MTATTMRRLVNSIIRNHFGESVQYVVDVLILKGECSLAALVHASGLSGKVVREALFVLIHHSLVHFNCTAGVTAATAAAANSPASLTTYKLDLDAVLCRVAYGQVVARVALDLSVEAADLLLEIIVAGRLPATSIVESHEFQLKSLLAANIVEVVTPEMSHFSATTCGEKRKLDEQLLFPANNKRLKVSSSEDSSQASNHLFIRFNAKATIFRLVFTEKVVQIVSKRLNPSAGKVIEAVLSLSAGEISPLNPKITFNTFQLSQKLSKDVALPLESSNPAGPLLQYLQVLAQNFDFIEAQSSLGANAFVFDVEKALRYLRMMMIESFVKARFGLPSARIFRILLTKKMYEERQIAKVAMITSKEVRERLFALLKLGLVHLQEVPKSADHAPSRTIFLWSVPERANHLQPSKSGLFRSFAGKLAMGLINLRDLSVLERRKHAQLLEKVERSDVASNLDLLSSGEQKQLADLKQVLKVLHIKADEIFNDFIIFKE